MTAYMKKPCKTCPFRIDVVPFLHPSKAEEIAYSTQNPYNSFSCHNTYSHDDDDNVIVNNNTKVCAGFLTMMAQNDSDDIPEGFIPAWDLCYGDPYEMITAYEERWESKH